MFRPKQYNIILFLRRYFPSLTSTSKGCYLCYLKVKYQHFTVHLPASERQKQVGRAVRGVRVKEREKEQESISVTLHMHAWLIEKKEDELHWSNHHIFDISLSCLVLKILLCFCRAYHTAKLHSLSSGERQFLLFPVLKESESLEKVTGGRLQ